MSINRLEISGILVEEALTPGGESSARPPLLLVHGACHGAWCWENWMAVLPGKGWSAYAISLRNHPGSYPIAPQPFLSETTVEHYAADVRTAAGHIARPCIVVGHSLGGITAQKYLAEQHAAGAHEAGAILLTSSPPGQLGAVFTAPLPTDAPYAFEPAAAAERYFYSKDRAVWGPAVERLVGESPSVLNQARAAGVPIDPTSLPEATLVVSAEHDNSSVPHDRRIADFYGADYLLAEGIGHDVMLDAGWEGALEGIVTWLDSRFPAS